MWNPFRSPKVRPVLVKDTDPAPLPSAGITEEIETERLRSLANRVRAQIVADSIYDRLAEQAVDKIRGQA